nr:MAG TPA: hypothetical protein [Caudoviricetes sp.]
MVHPLSQPPVQSPVQAEQSCLQLALHPTHPPEQLPLQSVLQELPHPEQPPLHPPKQLLLQTPPHPEQFPSQSPLQLPWHWLVPQVSHKEQLPPQPWSHPLLQLTKQVPTQPYVVQLAICYVLLTLNFLQYFLIHLIC